ncbi:hypothetical protein EVAR_56250_1 [Eumeta japonica]|uniref:Uncharacterized protein n=1 Tax=Eumeta variegata TaxID=151549 RepID=A0A4C1XID9_EUMVA|nr:hypothetical protein EVAR_56250_1 [Eumeta japonica]
MECCRPIAAPPFGRNKHLNFPAALSLSSPKNVETDRFLAIRFKPPTNEEVRNILDDATESHRSLDTDVRTLSCRTPERPLVDRQRGTLDRRQKTRTHTLNWRRDATSLSL